MIEAIVSYLLMLQKNINSKQNTLKKKILHCLGDISKVFFFLLILILLILTKF